jgi:hypothetical protein
LCDIRKIHGAGPNYSRSRGENKISKILREKGLSFRREATFSDCLDKGKLKFDFSILDSNNRISCLIEYHGEQHFKPIELFGGENNLKETQKRDQIKSNYCADKNIKLITFIYKDYNNL